MVQRPTSCCQHSKMFPEGLSQLASYIEARKDELKQLVYRIQCAILRVLKAEHHQREECNKQAAIQAKALFGRDAGK